MRVRLTLWFTLAVAVIAVAGGFLGHLLLERQLMNGVDDDARDQLALYAQAVSGATGVGDLVSLTESYLSGDASKLLRQKGMVLALQTAEGAVVSNSNDVRLEELEPMRALLANGERALDSVSTAAGPYRLAGTPVILEGARVGAVVVGAPLQSLYDTVDSVTLLLAMGVLVGVALVGIGSWLLVGSALGPVRRITRTAAAISREDLSRRIGYRGPKDEVGELAATMDGMLDRLEEAFAAQDEFVSDVSHELRTPLTIAKGHLQVLARQPTPDMALIWEGHGIVMEELDRMNRLVEDLLSLSRASRVDLLRREAVAVDPFLTSLAAQGPHLGERQWRVEALPGGIVNADQDRLTQVFLNLMQNAVNHTVIGQVIALGGVRDEDGVLLWVRDEGEGMSEEVRERVFERKYRDPSGGQAAGLGLGLAIVRALVEAHGGDVRVESAPGRGSRFTVRIREFSPGT